MATTLTFLITGDASDEGAQTLETLLRSWGDDLTVQRARPEQLSQETRKAIELMAVAALIVSLPSAALAVWNLVDRIKKRQRAQTLIDAVQRLSREKKVEVYIVTSEGPKPVNNMTPDQIVEWATSTAQASKA